MIKKLTLRNVDGYQVLNAQGRGVFISHQVGDRNGDPYDLIRVQHIYITKPAGKRESKIEYGRRKITSYDTSQKGGRVTNHLEYPTEISKEVIEAMTLLLSEITGSTEKSRTAKSIGEEVSDQEYIADLVKKGELKHL